MKKQRKIVTSGFETDLGWMAAQWTGTTLKRLTFGHSNLDSALRRLPVENSPRQRLPAECRQLQNRLQAYASGHFQDFADVAVDESSWTPFQTAIVKACRRIGWGDTATYGELAESAGSPRAARAVGNVMAHNQFPIVVPCHRVVASGVNRWGGFTAPGGVPLKRRMLELEQQVVMA